jgi:hypothetical protein
MRPIILPSAACLFCLYRVFQHYLINGTNFWATLLNTKCVFSLSLQLLSKMFLILRRIQWDIIMNLSLHYTTRYFCYVWISQHMVTEYSYIKFHKKPSSEAELFHTDGNTDGQTGVTVLRVAFRNCTNAPRKERYRRRVRCNLSIKNNQSIYREHKKYDCRILKTVLRYFGDNYETSEKSINLRDK